MSDKELTGHYPFAGRCPLCSGPIDGLVEGKFCLGGGGPFSGKVSGLIQHRCSCCGKSIGLRLRIGPEGVEIIGSGAYIEMLGQDFDDILKRRGDSG